MTNPTVTNMPNVPDLPNKSGASADNAPADAGAAISTEDDLLNSISQNFGGESESTIAKAKQESLAEMNKKLPDWNLEPPEVFLS